MNVNKSIDIALVNAALNDLAAAFILVNGMAKVRTEGANLAALYIHNNFNALSHFANGEVVEMLNERIANAKIFPRLQH